MNYAILPRARRGGDALHKLPGRGFDLESIRRNDYMRVIFMTVVLEFSPYPSRQTSNSLSQLSQGTRPVRTHFLRIIAVCAAGLFTTAVSAQQDFSKVEIRTEKLADTVYMMTGQGGNLGVSVGEDAVFVRGRGGTGYCRETCGLIVRECPLWVDGRR